MGIGTGGALSLKARDVMSELGKATALPTPPPDGPYLDVYYEATFPRGSSQVAMKYSDIYGYRAESVPRSDRSLTVKYPWYEAGVE